MATTKLTFSAVLGSVQATAATLTNTVEAANQSVGILTAFIRKSAKEQQLQHLVDEEVFTENLIRSSAEEETLSEIKIQQFCKQSKEHSEGFTKSYDKFTQLLRAK